jgi:Tol biopolymer transport system component
LFEPHVLPGDEAILYVKTTGGMDQAAIFGLRFGGEEVGPIATQASQPQYAHGYLLYRLGDGTISALPFDSRNLKGIGKAIKMARIAGASAYDVAGDVLVYVTGEARLGSKQLISVDRSGASRSIGGLPSEFVTLSVSPNGRRIALAGVGSESDIWTYDTERAVSMRVTFEPDEDETPVWSPDGTRIAYAANRDGKRVIALRTADGSGSEQILCTTEGHSHTSSWSSDGKFIAFTVLKVAAAQDVYIVPASGGKAQPFISSPFSKVEAVFSPDGRWLAYTSNETGRWEVYVTAFPGPGGRLQISNMGGVHPVWAANGRELYYRDRNHIMSVSIQGGQELKAGAPRPMFDAPDYVAFGVTPEGRFIALPVEESKNPASLNVVLNWTADLKSREADEAK